MRAALVASLVLVPSIAAAGGRRDTPEVRDHRSHDDGPTVRDHRSHDSDDDKPAVRDHRNHDAPVVRDHRGDDAPVVRDHRGSTSSGTVIVEDDPVYVSDGGSPGFSSLSRGPSWRLEFGGIARRFQGPAFNRSGTVDTTSGTTASYDLASGTPAAGDTAGGAFSMRFIVPASEHLYAGGDLELGGLTRSPVQLMTDSPDVTISSRAMFGTSLAVGARMQHGRAELDAEMAAGLRIVSLSMQSVDAMEGDPSESETALSGLLEARLRGILWVSPHVYLAAQAGTSVLDRSDVNVGLAFGLSSHDFGSAR